jgi:hypothetical protein
MVERRARRRFDAHMRHEAGQDELLATETIQRRLQRGAGKRIGQALFDDGFRAGRGRRVGNVKSRGVRSERPAGTPAMLDMNDRSAGLARAPASCRFP